MNRLLKTLYIVALAMVASGCASVTGSTNQSVSVQARQQSGVEVVGATCELTNDEGKWFMTTPGSTTIHRSNKTLDVLCKKDGFNPGRTSVESSTKGAMWGNIILGGAVGAVVDHNSGAAYEYPTIIQVIMASLNGIKEREKSGTKQRQTKSFGPSDKDDSSRQSNKEKLEELKRIFDEGLIGKDVYLDQQRVILSNEQ